MDTWQDEQLRRMQLGGNKPFKDFMNSYTPAEQGGYRPDSTVNEKYHSWAAAQYKEKLDALLAGRDWSSSAPPPGFGLNSRSASPAPSAAGLRKSRTSGRSGLASTRSASQTPSIGGSSNGTPNPAPDQKSQNESYFANLGKANENRPDHLPPSQGGKYTGFGSTPTPQNPTNPLSSANAPTLGDLQENPVAALSKGWSLFAAAVAGATKVVSENVIQPGVEKVTDPNFQATVKGYMTDAQRKAAIVGSSANEWGKHSFGVDVADTVGGVARSITGGPSRQGYGQLSLQSPNEFGDSGPSSLYDPRDEDDFFNHHSSQDQSQQATTMNTASVGSTSISRAATTTGSLQAKKPPAKKEDDWDEWKDF
ncbi:ARF GTPase activator [Coprinopsis marcescibilis]|uniref:ARF GTPase activator n=1 Tax=Coprinopsis marcescibilis TaxID=230819 RepID=A0A5C3KJM0_COPMA|nr:ARF GTPase activator [Coprinopsis marcescibilis]